jgi:hypothetical protein
VVGILLLIGAADANARAWVDRCKPERRATRKENILNGLADLIGPFRGGFGLSKIWLGRDQRRRKARVFVVNSLLVNVEYGWEQVLIVCLTMFYGELG